MRHPYLKNETMEYQAADFAMHTTVVLEAIARANKKYLGFDVIVSEEITIAVKNDILYFGIQLGRYAPELKDYLIDCGDIVERPRNKN